MSAINRKSKIPYYQQLYDILRDKISRGEWKPGDLIPAESEMTTLFEVSRNTIREVMDMLVNEGFIYRQQGRGSFVSQPTMEQGLFRIINFTEDMHQRGFTPSSKVLSAETLPAPEDIAGFLQIPPGEELGLLRRLRLGNGEPVSIEEAYFVHRLCPGFLTRHDYSTFSLREALTQDYGMRWQSAKQVIRPINAPREIANQLAVQHRAALLFVERITFTDQDIPAEFLRIYYRGDRYSLFNELHP